MRTPGALGDTVEHRTDAHAKFQEFAANALGSPKAVLGHHSLDEGDDIAGNARLAANRQSGTCYARRAGIPWVQ